MDEFEIQMAVLIERKLASFPMENPACPCGEVHPLCLRPPSDKPEDGSAIYCHNCWHIMRHRQLSPTQQKKRDANTIRKLKGLSPVCMTCGLAEPCTFELHHWLQQGFSPDLQVNCRNCHQLFSAAQYSHRLDPGKARNWLIYAAKMLFALADEIEIRALRRRRLIAALAAF